MASAQEEYDRHILQAIASGRRITQRSLADELGVALGLTNLLVRRLVFRGYVKVAGIGGRHVRYMMTGKGRSALGRAMRLSLENTVRLYTETREQIRGTLGRVSERCAADEACQKRVVFYGAGDVAEIAYISLQRTDLRLVAVADDDRQGAFFGLTIATPDQLCRRSVDGVEYDHLIITSLHGAQSVRRRLLKRGVPADRVWCLAPRPNSVLVP